MPISRKKRLLLMGLGALFFFSFYKTLSLAVLLRSELSGSQIDQFVIFASLNVFLLYALLILWLGVKEGIDSASTIAMTFATVVVALFAWLQIHQDLRTSEIERTAKWGKLRNTIWDLMDMYPKEGIPKLQEMPLEKKVQWLKDIRGLLDSEIDNPVLISDQKCLGHWRNAISSAKTGQEIIPMAPEMFETTANSVLKDVTYVWEKLVLNTTKEVSPTGGRPKD
jgi:hypothetical protein